MTNRKSLLICCGFAVQAALLAGCLDSSDLDFVHRKHDDYIRRAKGIAPEAEPDAEDQALEMVKKHPVGEDLPGPGERTATEQWIQQHLDELEGQVLFPRWEVRRRGQSRYEVRFTFTVMKTDYSIDRRGFSWSVDYTLRLVGPRIELDAETLDQESGHRPLLQRTSRETDQSVNLE